MLGRLAADLASVFSHRQAERIGRASHETLARFSDWLPYLATIEARRIFVNRDALGFALELRPQSGADEEMARILAALFTAAPAGAGIQIHLLASPAIYDALRRYARLRVPDPELPEF